MKLIFIILYSVVKSLQEKTPEFDWRFDIMVTERNDDVDFNKWNPKTFCYNGCPLSSNYIPEKGFAFQHKGMTWKCKIESKEETDQTLRTPNLITFSETRSFECHDPKSDSLVRELLSCEKDAKTGRKLQSDMLGYNFEKINIEQKINGKLFRLDITIECK